jgi:bla regulator protein BlaR1
MNTMAKRDRVEGHCLRMLLLCALCATSAQVLCQESPVESDPQAQVTTSQGMSFDVVSIRPSKSDKGIGLNFTPDEFWSTDMSLQIVITYAYNLVGRELRLRSGGKLLPGAPGWMLSDRYNIRPKLSPSDVAALQRLTLDQQEKQKKLMIRSMLADRFKLRVRQETKSGPCYALEVDKNGPKITQAAAPLDPSSREGDILGWPGGARAQSSPLSHLIFFLASELNCPVQDRTGLTGNYAFSLQYSVDQGSADPSSEDALKPSLFTAIREQMGLRLMPVTIPIEGIVIEHVERPSEN